MGAAIRQINLLARREMRMLLVTPLFWVLSGVFFIASAITFVALLLTFASSQYRTENDLQSDVTVTVITQLFWTLHFFLMIQVPMLTMRTFAEERRHGSLALLRTTPAGEWSLVLGKFLGNTFALVVYLAITLVFPVIVEMISQPDWMVVFTCYGALFMSVCAYTALGLFYSALTDSQVVAAVLTYVTLFMFIIISGLTEAFPSATLALVTQHLTTLAHVNGLLEGNFELRDLAFFVLFTFLFLFFSVRQLESLRWRQ